MFQFPWFASLGLCIQPVMTGLYPGRVAPFGYPWIYARLQLPMAFRSLPRPSSPPCAKAFTTRPYSLDPLIKPSLQNYRTRTHLLRSSALHSLPFLFVKKQPSNPPRRAEDSHI